MSYSKSVFFVPVWFDDYSAFVAKMQADGRWTVRNPEEYKPRYLIRYAARIAEKTELFVSYRLKEAAMPSIYMYAEELTDMKTPQVEKIQFSLFATGVGFVEVWVNYENATPEQITDFAYWFKRVKGFYNTVVPNGQQLLGDVVEDLLPQKSGAVPFFSVAADFKRECNCFHFLHVDTDKVDPEEAERRLLYLIRSYNRRMPVSRDSEYDMLYKSSENDHWGGSSEGFVNITYDLEPENPGYYLHVLKLESLEIDYLFMWLLLLNQRFSTIAYIEKVTTALSLPHKEVERLNHRIVELKTVFSFNVISDDRIFQNVYSRMYQLLNIEKLVADIVENEEQMDILQKAKAAKTERMSSKFLFGISLLSLFSALIDASGFFDRFMGRQVFSTITSIACVVGIVVVCLIWLLRGKE